MSIAELRNGQLVQVDGKQGIILENADKFKVKFSDGTFGFFSKEEIKADVQDTRLKGFNQQCLGVEPEQVGPDPLAQPLHRTRANVGVDQEVLGMVFGGK